MRSYLKYKVMMPSWPLANVYITMLSITTFNLTNFQWACIYTGNKTTVCMFIVRFCDCNTCIISIIVWRSNNLFSILSWMSSYFYFHVWLYKWRLYWAARIFESITNIFHDVFATPKQGITVPIHLSRQLKFWTTLSCRLNAHNEPRVLLTCLGDRK